MHINRSLGRGLRMLALLNAGGEHRVASLARAVQLPRSTAFRILCTLVEEGYVARDPVTDVYYPTAMVLALSDGFDAMARLVHAARPLVAELGRTLVWPVTLATPSGTSVLLRQTTDASSPLAVVRYSPGCRAPILEDASGLVVLAFSDFQQRQMILDLLYRDQDIVRQHGPRQALEHRIAHIQCLGYACEHSPAQPSDRSSLAVPVRTASGTLAALAVRFARSAVGAQVIMERLLPALRTTAHAIVARFDASAAAAPGDVAPADNAPVDAAALAAAPTDGAPQATHGRSEADAAPRVQ
jgi:IclR family mhp operon transcriptional activator